MFNYFRNKIKNKKANVLVIGLGYVGFPLLKLINKKKFKVYGLDLNSKKINVLKKYHKSLKLFKKYSDINFKKIDIIIIALPTPIDSRKNPDLSYLINCINKFTFIFSIHSLKEIMESNK